MALDTRDKRASSIGVAIPFGRLFPNPDGSLATVGDRQQSAMSYRGIAASAAVVFNPAWIANINVYIPRRGHPR